MKKFAKIFVAVAMMAVAVGLHAATETVDGITWTYTVTHGNARIGDGATAAIPTSTGGGVVIPSTLGGYPVATIGEDAFYGCTNLTSITIPESVTSISGNAFSGCSSLTSMIVSTGNLNFSSVGGVLFSKDKTKLICGPTVGGTYIIPNTVTNIGDYAFSGCHNLTSVLIPDSVATIGDSAFSDCSSLAFVTILDGVTSIGAYAFSDCGSLAYVTIPDSVTTIFGHAFSGCTNLTSIVIPDSVTFIGASAFYNCSGLSSIRLSENITSIGSDVFSGCSGLTSITIPDSVTSIGDHAFYRCSGLSSITIPNGVTRIDSGAFSHCRSLTSITIPNRVTYVGRGVFENCSSLETIKVDVDATFNVDDLLDSNNARIEYYVSWEYTVVDGKATITGCSKKVSGAISIPAEIDGYPVVAIGDRAFDGVVGITSIAIPEGVTRIGDNAFAGCSGLTSIVIPSAVTRVGSNVFTGCTNLQTITIDSDAGFDAHALCEGNDATLKSYVQWKNKYTAIDGKATLTRFSTNVIGDVVIPGEIDGYPVVAIGDAAFRGCEWMTSVVIPGTVTNIGQEAFSSCTRLASLSIGPNIASVGENAFYGCDKLHTLTMESTRATIPAWFEGKITKLHLMIPNGTTEIWKDEFGGCAELVSLAIPESVVRIEGGVFAACGKLRTLTIASQNLFDGLYESDESSLSVILEGSSVRNVVVADSIKDIGSGSFSDCSGLTSITLGNGVTNIADHAFSNCGGLRSITIPRSVMCIGDNAFESCRNIRTLTAMWCPNGLESQITTLIIPKGTECIPLYAFDGCTGLVSVEIPDSVKAIGIYAFRGCSNLRSITIPENVWAVGRGVFAGCLNLETLTIESESVLNIADGFWGSSDGGAEYWDREDLELMFGYPEYYIASLSEILNDPETGGVIAPEIVLAGNVKYIGPHAFSACYLSSLTIPPSVTNIAENAFTDCGGIRTLTAAWCPNGLESQITTLTIPEGTECIPPDAFAGCTGLVSVEIPDSVKAIGFSAFRGCSNLRSITIPENVWAVGRGVFAGCWNLETLTIESESVLNIASGFWGSPEPEGSGYWDLEDLLMFGDPEYYIASLSEILGDPWGSEGAEPYEPITPEIVLAGNVKYIGPHAFSACYLPSLTIPPSVTNIAENAFSDCNGIRALTAAWCPNGLESQITTLIIPEGTEYIPPYAFAGCTGLVSVEIPDSVKAIGISAFRGCSNLRSITIPENVWAVGRGVFAGCWNLETLTIESESVLNIASGFWGSSDEGSGYWDLEDLLMFGDPEYYIASLSEILGDPWGAEGDYAEVGGAIAPEIVLAGNVKYIGPHAFSACYLPSLTIPPSVTNIAENAFTDCGGIRTLTAAWCPNGLEEQVTSLTIPKGTQYIPPYAFDGCTGLVSVEIPDSVKYIGEEAFRGCTSLRSITIPKNVEEMGWSVFAECGNLWTITIESPTLVHWGDNIYPYPEYPRTSLEYILEGSSIMDVVVGGNVKGIGSGAFDGCWGLMSITIGNGVTNISDSAFRDCRNLMFVTIPSSVTHVGSLAFENCGNLTEICVPTDASYASQLESLYGGKITYYIPDTTVPDPEPSNVIWEYELDKGVAMITGVSGSMEGEVTIPSTIDGYSVTGIDDYAFYYCGDLTSITVPRCVKTIGRYAFAGCSRLTTVIIQDGVTSIGSGAFSDCASLTSFTLPVSVAKIAASALSRCYGLMSIDVVSDNPNYSSVGGVLFNKEKTTLMLCPMQKSGSYEIPDSVTSIGDEAFYGCSGLTSITIPDSVTSIGLAAFSGCSGLRSVTIPQLVLDKGLASVFQEYDSITSIVLSDNVTNIRDDAFYYYNNLTSVTIGNSVTNIGSEAFRNCSSLTSIVIPNSVISIGSYAFNGCSSLTSVTIGNGVTNIGAYAFFNCSSLTSVTIPNGVTRIGVDAFRSCGSLTSINVDSDNQNYSSVDGVLFNKAKTILMCCPAGKGGSYEIPDSVTAINGYAFYNCSKLTSVSIPNSVTNIGTYAFYGCSGLTSATMGNSVASIGSYAFRGCSSLTSVSIPNSVTNISTYAFYGCSGLTSLTIGNGVTIINGYAFYNCSSLTSVSIPNSVTNIGTSAFYGCSGLTSLTIGNGVTIINGYAFYNCSSLTSVSIPNSVTNIGTYAFYGCSGLTSAAMGNSVLSIGGYAFRGCSNLTSVSIPNSVTNIGTYAFYNCNRLTSITIPGSVTSIGRYAFVGTALNEIRIPIGASYSSQLEREYPGKIVYCDPNGLNSPAAVQASDGMYADKVVVTWKAVRGATSYKIYRAQRNDSSDATLIASDITDTSYEDTATTVGTMYYYWVKVVKDDEESGFSAGDGGFLAVLINGIAFSTEGNQKWTFDSLDPFGAVSGTISHSQSSTLKGVVSGRGVLTFKWKVSSESSCDKLSFSVDGTQKAQISGEKDWAEISVDVSANGTHTFTWTYSKDGSVVKGSDCGWIKDVEWRYEKTDDGVPHFWIDEIAAGNSELKQLLADKGYEEVANAPAANGKNTIGECFVIGIDPTEEKAAFQANIELVDGVPKITYTPDLGQERVYVTEGCAELGGEWKAINSDADKEGLRFFRVKVALPR